jgi:hypothetical protein
MKYELKRGEKVQIDLSALPALEPIVLTLTARLGKYHKMSSVRVDKEYTGFQAEIRSVMLLRDEDAEKSILGTSPNHVDSYEIEIDWGPGGDSSRADIAVT